MSTERNGFRLEDAHHSDNELVIVEEQNIDIGANAPAVTGEVTELAQLAFVDTQAKTVQDLLREEAEVYAMEYLWRNEPAATGMDRMELRSSHAFALPFIFLIDGYLAGYEAAEKSIRAELSSPKIPTKKSKRPTKSSKKSGAKKLSPVRKTTKSANKTSSRTKRNRISKGKNR